jgi:hypothetical protein
MSLIFNRLPKRKGSIVYLVKTDTKTAVKLAFSTQIYTKPQRSVIVVSRDGRKHKHVPQLHKTEKTDRNLGFENAPSSAGMSCKVCKLKLGCVGQCTAVCQMHAAQLLTALGPPNAQQTISLLRGNICKINGI